ncbi:cytokine receptor family member b4 isoform X2 [Amia ocellicauda]|uniref:cytokine receptor family member b4 isoform X2 n=1 Tax=Amia ocellicauda TaxID=2972642 RepID=UPI0034648E91
MEDSLQTGEVVEETACQGITERKCDLTKLLSVFGQYNFKVRAEQGIFTSPWVQSPRFSLELNTTIGPPSQVSVDTANGFLHVQLQDPVTNFKNKTLEDVYGSIEFNVRYWKDGEEEKTETTEEVNQRTFALTKLQSWTKYCVQAQVFIKAYNKRGEYSKAVCKTTTTNEKTPVWLIIGTLICSFLAFAALVLLLFYVGFNIYRLLHFAFPTCKLPEHFKQYLTDPPHSYVFLAMQNPNEPEEMCNEISIVCEESETIEMGENTQKSGVVSGEEFPQDQKECIQI